MRDAIYMPIELSPNNELGYVMFNIKNMPYTWRLIEIHQVENTIVMNVTADSIEVGAFEQMCQKVQNEKYKLREFCRQTRFKHSHRPISNQDGFVEIANDDYWDSFICKGVSIAGVTNADRADGYGSYASCSYRATMIWISDYALAPINTIARDTVEL